MALFKHKNGGVCEVLTIENIAKLRKNPNYQEIKPEKEKKKETKKLEEESKESK